MEEIDKFEHMSSKERHKRYLAYLGINEETYQEIMKALKIDIKDPYPPIYFGPFQDKLNQDNEVRLDVDTVRSMGMIIDPSFLLDLRVNGITVDFVFRLAKFGEVPDRYLRKNF